MLESAGDAMRTVAEWDIFALLLERLQLDFNRVRIPSWN